MDGGVGVEMVCDEDGRWGVTGPRSCCGRAAFKADFGMRDMLVVVWRDGEGLVGVGLCRRTASSVSQAVAFVMSPQASLLVMQPMLAVGLVVGLLGGVQNVLVVWCGVVLIVYLFITITKITSHKGTTREKRRREAEEAES